MSFKFQVIFLAGARLWQISRVRFRAVLRQAWCWGNNPVLTCRPSITSNYSWNTQLILCIWRGFLDILRQKHKNQNWIADFSCCVMRMSLLRLREPSDRDRWDCVLRVFETTSSDRDRVDTEQIKTNIETSDCVDWANQALGLRAREGAFRWRPRWFYLGCWKCSREGLNFWDPQSGANRDILISWDTVVLGRLRSS